MAIDPPTLTLNLVRDSDDLQVDVSALQGLWTVQQYLSLTDQTRHLIEFHDGVLEILPMPTDKHQAIVQFLLLAFLPVIQRTGGKVQFAPLRLQIRPGRFREPDLLVVWDARDPRRQNRFWLGADLVVEIVSADDPQRDIRDKRIEYAELGIPEYWIVNPGEETITVLTLAGATYAEHAVFRRGETARAASATEVVVAVDDVLEAT